MKLTREEALRLHKEMWTNMQEKLGDNPKWDLRENFKNSWCAKHFPDETITNSCFLCEFLKRNNPRAYEYCESHCLIMWGIDDVGDSIACFEADEDNDEVQGVHYRYSPISEILALPERKVERWMN